MTLAPVAQSWQAFGLEALTTRYDVLLKRASRRKLSPREEGEVRGIALALEALQLINPEGVVVSERREPGPASRVIGDRSGERQ